MKTFVAMIPFALSAACSLTACSGESIDEQTPVEPVASASQALRLSYRSPRADQEFQRVGQYLVYSDGEDYVRLYHPTEELVFADSSTVAKCTAAPTECSEMSCGTGEGTCSNGSTWSQCDSLTGSTIICTCHDGCVYLPPID